MRGGRKNIRGPSINFQKNRSKKSRLDESRGFRYPPKLKAVAEERFPKTKIFLGELFPGQRCQVPLFERDSGRHVPKDGEWLREISPDLFIYLCMESKEVWEKVFGWARRTAGI